MEILIIIFIGTIIGTAFYLDWRKLKNENLYLEQQREIDRHNASRLTTLIQNLLLEEDLNLMNLSRLSRQFFNTDDLIKYGWEKTTHYNTDTFFYKEEEGPSLIYPKKGEKLSDDHYKLARELNKLAREHWNEDGEEENRELMEARRNFFIKHFPSKIYELADKYNNQNYLLDEKTVSAFIKRFSNLIK